MTKAKVQTETDYDPQDRISSRPKNTGNIDAFLSLTQNSGNIFTEGFKSGFDIVIGLADQVTSQFEVLAESTQSSLNFHYRMLREGINNCEQLSKVWIQHSIATFASSIDHTRTLGDKSTESMKAFARIVKTDRT